MIDVAPTWRVNVVVQGCRVDPQTPAAYMLHVANRGSLSLGTAGAALSAHQH